MAYAAQTIRLQCQIDDLDAKLEESDFQKTDMQSRLAWYLERVDRYSDGKSPLRVLKRIEKGCPTVARFPIAVTAETVCESGPAVHAPAGIVSIPMQRFAVEVFIGLGEDASPEVIVPHVLPEIEKAIYKYFRAQSLLVRPR